MNLYAIMAIWRQYDFIDRYGEEAYSKQILIAIVDSEDKAKEMIVEYESETDDGEVMFDVFKYELNKKYEFE